MLKAPRGTSDILPPETSKWVRLERVLRDVAERYGFQEIRTPTFEHSELFSRTVGEATDIVEKEMYTFKDKTGRDLTLRPEGTAAVARAFVEHAMGQGPLPRKFYYICPMFRYEKPQAGRFREHRQFGVEVLGSPSPYSDLEVILLASDVCKELGLLGTRLAVNSIGCSECRAQYKRDLVAYLTERAERLCADCRREVASAPRMLDYLCPDCKSHWDTLTSALLDFGIDYEVDHSLVRGLDYYTRTVFELKWPALGAQSTLFGGGRYDGLVEEIGGPPTPGVGFGMGMERVLLATDKGTKPFPSAPPPDVFVAHGQSQEFALQREAFALVQKLRSFGLSADFDPLGRSLKAQMKHADRMGARYVAILGDDEVRGGKVTIKSMEEGWQKTLFRDSIEEFVEEVRGHGK
mgnify:CR=1 FL=1